MSGDTLPARPELSHGEAIQGPGAAGPLAKLKSGMRANSSAS